MEGRTAPIVGRLLFKLYPYCRASVQRAIHWIVLKLEGGDMWSNTMRRILSQYYHINVGLYTDIGTFTTINFRPGTTIGRYTSIYSTAFAFSGNHPMNTKSTHAFFYNPVYGFCNDDILERTQLTIGNDVFIGHNVIILPEVTSIGDGAVLGAGSVIHKNIPPYAVAVGNPCRIIRYRFSQERIQELLTSKWWKIPVEQLLPNIDEFRRPLNGEDKIR